MNVTRLERFVKWDQRFLDLAQHVAQWSKDPSTKTGSVIVDPEGTVLALGYNGFPRGMADLPERYADREFKYAHVVHAERNAMLFAQRSLKGCTIYIWPFMPCVPCASTIVQAGITRCVAPNSDNPRWQTDFARVRTMFSEVGVQLDLIGSV